MILISSHCGMMIETEIENQWKHLLKMTADEFVEY